LALYNYKGLVALRLSLCTFRVFISLSLFLCSL